MSVSRGGSLARSCGSSLLGVSERDSGAAGCPCVLGRDGAAVQADGCAGRPREDLTEGTTVLSAHPVVTDCGPGGCCPCIHCFVPCGVPTERALCLRTGQVQKGHMNLSSRLE